MRVAILHNQVAADASAADRDVLVQVDAVREALEQLGWRPEIVPCSLDLESARRALQVCRPELVFNLVESLGGSDALMHLATALLDAMGIPYTGATTEAIFLTGDKVAAKTRLLESGLPTPAWLAAATRGAVRGRAALPRYPGRFVIKTVREHASFGLDDSCLVETPDEASLEATIRRHSARLARPCFAEAYVEGREFNLSVLAGPEGPEVLPPAEIDFSAFPAGKPRIVDYRAKWDEDCFEYRNTPRTFAIAAEDRPILERMEQLARRCWYEFGLRGYARVDFRVDWQGQPWILELNANPCLAPDAGLAAALREAGIAFHEAIRRIAADAMAGPWPTTPQGT